MMKKPPGELARDVVQAMDAYARQCGRDAGRGTARAAELRDDAKRAVLALEHPLWDELPNAVEAAEAATAQAERLADAIERIHRVLADEVGDSAKVNRIRGVLASLDTSAQERRDA